MNCGVVGCALRVLVRVRREVGGWPRARSWRTVLGCIDVWRCLCAVSDGVGMMGHGRVAPLIYFISHCIYVIYYSLSLCIYVHILQ